MVDLISPDVTSPEKVKATKPRTGIKNEINPFHTLAIPMVALESLPLTPNERSMAYWNVNPIVPPAGTELLIANDALRT